MALTERLAFLLSLDPSNALAGMRRVGEAADKDLGNADSRLDRLGGRMQIAGGAAVGFAAVAGAALLSFARASEEAAESQRRLENSIANAPQLAGASADEFVELAEAIQSKTAADGDAIVSGIALAGQMGLNREELLELTPLAVDLAQKMGIDLDAAFKAVAKAANGSTGQLERMIGPIADGETAMEALRRSVGGFAEEEGATFSGKLERLQNQLGDLQEGIGAGVVDALTGMIDSVGVASGAMAGLGDGTLSTVGTFATYGVAVLGAAGAASFLVGSLIKMRTNLVAAGTAAKGALSSMGGFSGIAPVAAAAAVGIGAIVFALQKNAENAAVAADRMERYAAVMLEAGDATTGARQSVADWAAEMAQLTGWMADLGITVDEVTTAFTGTQEEADAFVNSAMDAARAAGMSGDEVAVLGVNLGTLSNSVRGSIDQFGNLQDVESETAAATDELADATAAAAVKVNTMEEEVNDLIRAQEELYDATQRLAGNELSAAEAFLSSADALDSYNVTMADAEATDREKEQAGYDLVQSFYSTAEAAGTAAADQAIASGNAAGAQQASVAAQIAALQGLASTLEPGSFLYNNVAGHIAQLQSIPPARNTVVTADTGAAEARLNTLLSQIAALSGGTHEISFQTRYDRGPSNFAAGGSPEAGQLSRGGERGFETFTDRLGHTYFIPGDEGTVTPNHNLKTGGGMSVSNTFMIYGDPDRAMLDDAIARLNWSLSSRGDGL